MTELGADYSDTSRWSAHVDDRYYATLAQFVDTLAQDWPAEQAEVVGPAQNLLFHEARLIDSGRFNEWLGLFTDDCLYWVPVMPGGGDPRSEVSWAFDDRRRLTDRVYWLRTGLAFSQIPPSRTRRVIGNVEVLDEPQTDLRFVRSNFSVHEYRAGATKLYAGWYGHVLEQISGAWRIRLKQVNLLDSEQNHENLTLIF